MRDKLSYANVMATIAVVGVVAGGAGALAALPDSSGQITACYVPKDVTKTVRQGGRRIKKVLKKKGAVRMLVTGTKCAKGESKLVWNQRGPQGIQGLQGLQGLQGIEGAPATRLFAYVQDDGSSNAKIPYGPGATGVTEGAVGAYTVTFNRSLDNCTAFAQPGYGRPNIGSSAAPPAVALVSILSGGQVNIVFVPTNDTAPASDTSFMLAVFC
jgi:hypothetical protein